MALSNIFREPRREIIESAVGGVAGLAALGAIVGADYPIAIWLCGQDKTMPFAIGLIIGLLIIIPTLALAAAFLAATHALGDGICNALERRGVHLRPRERR